MSRKPFLDLIRSMRNRLSSENSQAFQKPFLRDLIYFDFDKTASIASQLEGGLIKEIQATYSQSRAIGGGIDVSLANVGGANIGGNANDSHSKMVTQSIHHDLLVRVEQALFKADVAVDLNQEFGDSVKADESKFIEELHKILSQKPYVRVEGMSEFQDYRRVKEYLDGAAQIEQSQTRKTKDQMLKFKSIVDLIMPNRNHLFVQPSESLHEFKIISNLKTECYVDRDPNNVLFHYGSQPNVKLTVFGLVTSVPSNNNSDNSKKAKSSNDGTKQISQVSDVSADVVSQVFDEIFEKTKPLEEFGQITHYPSITLYPFAVYRAIRTSS